MAQFNFPEGICTDASGNVYVSDTSNNRIRKITPSGVVSTFAGGVYGYADGTSTVAQFRYPFGICSDASGNLYVADSGNSRIRKITPSGVVSTFAGSGIEGYADNSIGINAQFNTVMGVCSDALGNIYLTDWGNNRIRKITPSGAVTTFAGSGIRGHADDSIGINAKFSNPRGICSDASGNLFVADSGNQRIRKITSLGAVTTFAGSGMYGDADGTSTVAQFNTPFGICSDVSGNVYVADFYNNKIRIINPLGVVTTFAGSSVNGFVNGIGTSAKFDGPIGICNDVSGNAFVADYFNNTIRKITLCNNAQ
ncbi:NHL_like_1 domain containing protein [Flavobacteriaceae bacterium]